MKSYSAIKKEGNSAICENEDETAKGNKLDRERQILYDFSYMWNLKKT